MTKNKILIGLIIVLLCNFFIGCSQNSLSGTYTSSNSNSYFSSFIFNKDGTVVAESSKIGKIVLNYAVNGKSVIITMQGTGMPFEINGNTLTDTNGHYGGPWTKK